MLQKVREQPYVTFVGVPGSGKSATAQHIALILQKEGYEVVPVSDFRDLTEYCDPQNPQVFVINDVIGVLGVQKAKLESFLEYEQKLIKPSFEKTKVLLTCRETLFNQLNKSFFTNEQNVIKLHSLENELSEDDQRSILEKHGLDRNLLSSALLTEASRMFPLLCKLYSNDQKFRINGERFFISPIRCIIEDFDKMQQINGLFYATLVLCMLHNNILSEDILKDGENKCLQKMKYAVLESCEVECSTDTFKFVKALSAMEGTYTKRIGTTFMFVHDSMFEITAYHFGRQFPELILQYMKSSYLANYVKLEEYNFENENTFHSKSINVIYAQTGSGKNSLEVTDVSCDDKNEVGDVTNLFIKLSKNLYLMFAERLYRDIENMELYDVFMNNALKDNQFCKDFIAVLGKRTYAELKDVFLSKQENVSKILGNEKRYHENNEKWNKRIETRQEKLLVDTRGGPFFVPSTCNVRVISWVIYYGHHQILRYILEQTELHRETQSVLFKGFSVGHGGFSGTTEQEANIAEQTRLLVLSCYSGDIESVRILLKHVDLNSSINRTPQHNNNSGYIFPMDTPLTAACLFGLISVVKELLAIGAGVDIPGHIHTPLTAACLGGHLSVVKELCKRGANVNLHGNRGHQLQVHIGNGVYILADLVFLNYDKNLNDSQCVSPEEAFFSDKDPPITPLISACQKGHLIVVKELLEWGADIHPKFVFKTPLTVACEYEHLNIVKELLKFGTNVNFNPWYTNIRSPFQYRTPLMAACEKGNLEIVRELLNANSNVNTMFAGKTPLTIACWKGSVGVVRELLRKRANVNVHGRSSTPLIASCTKGHVVLVRELLNQGAEVNQEIADETPLMVACRNDSTNILNLLLKSGANTNFQNKRGETPLHVALKNEKPCPLVLKMLLENGADCILCRKDGLSPLYIALIEKNINLIRLHERPEKKIKQKINLHLFHILVEIRRVGVITDSKDDVVLKRNKFWCLKEDWHFNIIKYAGCVEFKQLLKFGLDSNQDILIWSKFGDIDLKPLLFKVIDGSRFRNSASRSDVVNILLKAGADVNLRAKYKEYTFIVDKIGVSALERTRRLICQWKNTNLAFGMEFIQLGDLHCIKKDIKKRVRRYSV
ncbi:uncharacterized protein LOC134255601 [Saccostrea cucullata]|uniref:uncharacterized protein LOC134255601 n=1 Tax=Saccostrea cuccullata TaxID=36930 RepID=UPI002ED31E6E